MEAPTWHWILLYLGVASLAGAVGLAEIYSRYRDVPVLLLREWPAWIYIATNAVAGVAALFLIETLGLLTFDNSLSQPTQWLVKMSAAAFGALAVLRSAVIQVRINNNDLNVGPSFLLTVLLDSTARSMSRKRASFLNSTVKRIMTNIDFDRAKQVLPSYCFSLMNTPDDDQMAVSREITSYDISSLPNNVKSLKLGLVLLNLVGEDILSQAIDTLKNDIQFPPK